MWCQESTAKLKSKTEKLLFKICNEFLYVHTHITNNHKLYKCHYINKKKHVEFKIWLNVCIKYCNNLYYLWPDREPCASMIVATSLSRRNFKLEKSLKCKRFSFIPTLLTHPINIFPSLSHVRESTHFVSGAVSRALLRKDFFVPYYFARKDSNSFHANIRWFFTVLFFPVLEMGWRHNKDNRFVFLKNWHFFRRFFLKLTKLKIIVVILGAIYKRYLMLKVLPRCISLRCLFILMWFDRPVSQHVDTLSITPVTAHHSESKRCLKWLYRCLVTRSEKLDSSQSCSQPSSSLPRSI